VKQLLAGLESFVTIILVLTGLAGLCFQTFRENGWLSQGFGKIADTFINFPVVALRLTVAMFFSFRSIRNAAASRGGRVFDLIVYVLMAAGTYFIAQYVLKGEI
jgi:hypothetical protein